LFSAGFRPFFLAAGIWPVLVLPPWLAMFAGGLRAPQGWLGSNWHAHEMLHGYALAAIAGFLLTAVPKWTACRPLNGVPLGMLFVLWLSGRLALCLSAYLPPAAVAVVDCAFAPGLSFWVGRAVLVARSRHNYGFILLLATVCAGNLLMHGRALGLDFSAVFFGERLSLYAVLAMLVIIAGRVVPGFTQGVLQRKAIVTDPRASRWIERATFLALGVAAAADLLHASAHARGAAFSVLGLCLVARMLRWRTRDVLDQPILWILHAGQLWLVVGCGLEAFAAFSAQWPELAAQHAFTAGAIGTTVLGMMTRAALGHSGRALQTGHAIVAAYWLVIVGGLLRVLAPVLPAHYVWMVTLGGSFWVAGYGIFVAVYLPILTKPNAEDPAARGKRKLITV
jgi:uncharacterized protein involved in response to NO